MHFSTTTILAFTALTTSIAAQRYPPSLNARSTYNPYGAHLAARSAFAEAEEYGSLYARSPYSEPSAYPFVSLAARDAHALAEADDELDIHRREALPQVPADHVNGCPPGSMFYPSNQPGASKSLGKCIMNGQRVHRNGQNLHAAAGGHESGMGGAGGAGEAGGMGGMAEQHGAVGGKVKDCASAGKGLVLIDGKCKPSKNCAAAGRTFSAKTGKCV